MAVSVQYVSEIERSISMLGMQVFVKINLYGDKQIATKLERLAPNQQRTLMAIIDAYIENLD